MKIIANESELRQITENAVKKALTEIIKSKKGKDNFNGYIKANRKASREIEKDYKSDGFKSTNKVHKSIKDYSRKGRNKNSWKNEITVDEN